MVKNPPAMQETWVQSLGQGRPAGEGNVCLPTPVEFHGQRNLVGYSPWGHKELERTNTYILSKRICKKLLKFWHFVLFCVATPLPNW